MERTSGTLSGGGLSGAIISGKSVRKRLPMKNLVKVTLLIALAISFPFGYGQASNQAANITAVPAGTAPVTTEWPHVTLNILTEPKGHDANPPRVSAWQVLVDGVPQKIESIDGPGTPVSLCLQVDVSGSMRGYSRLIRDAAVELVSGLPPGSEVMIAVFGGKDYLVVPFRPASAVDLHLFERLRYEMPTALYDSIVVSENYFIHSAHNRRRAFVLISDTGENASRHGLGDVKHAMLTPGSPFAYLLAPFDEHSTESERFPLFSPLVGMFKAREFDATRESDILKPASEISRMIDSQYALSYTSAATMADKRLHKIEVTIPGAEGQMKIDSPPGYYISEN